MGLDTGNIQSYTVCMPLTPEPELRDQVLSVKVTRSDREAMTAAAAREGMSLSEYLRATALAGMAFAGDREAAAYARRAILHGLIRVTLNFAERIRTGLLGQPRTGT